MASAVVSQMLHESRRQVRPGKGLRNVKRHRKDAKKGQDLPRTPKGDFRGGAYEGPAGPDEKSYAHLAAQESGQIKHKKLYPKGVSEAASESHGDSEKAGLHKMGGSSRGRR